MGWLWSLLSAMASGFGSLWQRVTVPADASLLNRYEMRITHLETQLAECVRHHEQSEKDNRQLHQELDALRGRLVSLEGQQIHGMVAVDLSGKIIEANLAACVMSGYPAVELIGMELWRLIPYRYRAGHARAFTDVATETRPLRLSPVEGHLLTKEGSEMPVTITLTSWLSPLGKRQFGADLRRRA